MSTLREMRDEGWSIVFYCTGYCSHSWSPSWDQLIQYFGPDANFVTDRSGFARLVCEKCGTRGAKVTVHPNDPIKGRGTGGHIQSGPSAVAEANRSAESMRVELERVGFKSNAELHRASKEALRAARKAEKKGDNFIGPPNPYAGRKAPRPPMK